MMASVRFSSRLHNQLDTFYSSADTLSDYGHDQGIAQPDYMDTSSWIGERSIMD